MSYWAPRTIDEALALLTSAAAAAGAPAPPAIVAGGTDAFAAFAPGRRPRAILDVTRIDAMRGIAPAAGDAGGGWRIGAATPWRAIIDAALPPAFDGLKAAAREVGSVQIQNAGTIGGNLCNASPAADGIPPLLALDAEVEIASPRGARRAALAAFVTGARRIDLAADELLTAIHIPAPPAGAASAFCKLGARRYLVISIVMAAATLRLVEGRVADARIAVGACGPVARRLSALESAANGLTAAELERLPIDADVHLAPLRPIDDARGAADYRRHAAATLCRRAALDAVRTAAGGGAAAGRGGGRAR